MLTPHDVFAGRHYSVAGAPKQRRYNFISLISLRYVIGVLCLVGLALLFFRATAAAQTSWNLVWSDEFNGPAGSFPSSSNWTYDTGDGGWGNGELEIYCAAGSNAAPCNSSDPNIYEDGNG